MVLEELDLPLVPARLLERGKGAQVAAFAGAGIFLARIDAKFSGFEFANHADWDAGSRQRVAFARASGKQKEAATEQHKPNHAPDHVVSGMSALQFAQGKQGAFKVRSPAHAAR